jgi:hypothetical protein
MGRLAERESQHRFDLERGPLARAVLIRLTDTRHILLLTMHHIISDAWSMRILISELDRLYDAFSSGRPQPLDPLPMQYADYAQWQREWLAGDRLESLVAYWRGALEGAPAVLELPADRPRPAVQTFRGGMHNFTLSAATTKALKAAAQREGATLFMALGAAFFALLHRISGADDIVIGTPIANRNRSSVEGIVGFFINTLALRLRMPGDPSFAELLRDVRETTLAAYEHQDLPFEKVVEELQPERSLSRNAVFQVMFMFQSMLTASIDAATLGDAPVSNGTAKFDLTLSLVETEQGLIGGLEYSTDLFDASTMAALAEQFVEITDSVAANQALRLSQIAAGRDEQQRQSRRSLLAGTRRVAVEL